MTDKSGDYFLRRVKLAPLIRIPRDSNRQRFSIHRSLRQHTQETKRRAFDVTCSALPAEHRPAPRQYPQVNGRVGVSTAASTSY
jgi:hypothetical protein